MKKINPHKLIQYEQKGKDSCGPACLKIILAFYGIRKSEKNLEKLCKTTNNGTTIKNLIKAARKFELVGDVKEYSSIEYLKKNIKQKIPTIVDWFLEDDGHYSVVAGIDDKNIYLQDPSIGKIRKVELQKFKRIWFDFVGDFPKSKKEFILRRMITLKKEQK